MECFRLEILPGQRLLGRTADGQWTAIQPGEYVVHRLKAKVARHASILRFVGADDRGRDVHLPVDALPVALRKACAKASNEDTLSEAFPSLDAA